MNRFKEILYHPDMHDAKEALFTIRDKANAYKKLYPPYPFGEAALLEITNAINYYQTQRKAHQDKVQAKKVEDDRKKTTKKEASAKKEGPKRVSTRKKVRLCALSFTSVLNQPFLRSSERFRLPLLLPSSSIRTTNRVRPTRLQPLLKPLIR